MTFGEAHFAQSQSMQMVNGRWEMNKIRNKPPPMSREKASKYYNAKLDEIWLSIQRDKIIRETA